MATFSWSDTARAVFGSCLPCLPSSRPAKDTHDEHVTRRDELESLLQGAEYTDTENDADALSLHSHIGQLDGRRRVKKKKRTKHKGSISLFGFDLFGRPLARDAEDDDERRRVSRISTSTLDSDAAPLADDAIAELSAHAPEQRAADDARRERKRLRRLQKEAAARLDTHDGGFEGFPGSGALQDPPEDFGAFQQAPVAQEAHGGGPEEEDVEGDFDAGSYVRSAARPRSDSGSGTRSRTSASSSRPHPHLVPLPPSSAGSVSPAPLSPTPKPKRSKKSKAGARSPTTGSSTTASQPRSPTSAAPPPRVEIANPHDDDSAFDGVPGELTAPVSKRTRGMKLTGESVHGEEQPFAIPDFPSPGLGRSSGFPSPGLGRTGRKNSLQGAFLARTGEDA